MALSTAADRRAQLHHRLQCSAIPATGLGWMYFSNPPRRNLDRFPSDFVFQLTVQELGLLRSQFATSSSGSQQRAWGGRRYSPYAFTEHGAIMAAMVLNSARAIGISVFVVRAFVQQRDTLMASKELAKRLDELESRIERKLSTHDQAIAGILDAIRQLMAPPEPTKRRIGFHP